MSAIFSGGPEEPIPIANPARCESVDELDCSRHGLELLAEEFAIQTSCGGWNSQIRSSESSPERVRERYRRWCDQRYCGTDLRRTRSSISSNNSAKLRKWSWSSPGENTVDVKDHGMWHGRRVLGRQQIGNKFRRVFPQFEPPVNASQRRLWVMERSSSCCAVVVHSTASPKVRGAGSASVCAVTHTTCAGSQSETRDSSGKKGLGDRACDSGTRFAQVLVRPFRDAGRASTRSGGALPHRPHPATYRVAVTGLEAAGVLHRHRRHRPHFPYSIRGQTPCVGIACTDLLGTTAMSSLVLAASQASGDAGAVGRFPKQILRKFASVRSSPDTPCHPIDPGESVKKKS